jgi:hypothetical protein
VALHFVHGLQLDSWHSLGQRDVPHLPTSSVGPQAFPPKAGARIIRRKRWRNPVPQVTGHSDQGANAATMQSTGQGRLEHVLLSTSTGHDFEDAEFCATVILRDRCRIPPPHVLLHGEYDPHHDTSQSRTQAISMQFLRPISTPQGLPP